MLSYLEFINEDINKSISGLDRFGIGHDYKLHIVAVGAIASTDENKYDYDCFAFPTEKDMQDFLIKRYNFENWNALKKHTKSENFLIYHGETVDFGPVGDYAFIQLDDGTWDNIDKFDIFGKNIIYYEYVHYRRKDANKNTIHLQFSLDESLIRAKESKHRKGYNQPAYSSYNVGTGQINLKDLIENKIDTFKILSA